jgi:tRNA threonylcarbamoyladenosine biosynthesis protein TsaE
MDESKNKALGEYNSPNPEATLRLGQKWVRQMQAGDVVALCGDLGAGKTVLVKGMAKGLGYEGEVTSPTFTLVHEYPGRIPLYHMDWYRLEQASEVESLGLEDYFDGSGICVIEWADKIPGLLPKRLWRIQIFVADHEHRIIRLLDPANSIA